VNASGRRHVMLQRDERWMNDWRRRHVMLQVDGTWMNA